MKEFWNERFSSDTYLYGEEPNPHFKEFIDNNHKGNILLPGEGEGRNAVYAALQGWQVHAIDQSEQGMRKALLLAQKNKVSFDYQVGDILTSGFKSSSFDAIALVFLHLPMQVRKTIHSYLFSLLKPGGKFFIAGFSIEQLKYNTGGPKDVEMLYTSDLLREDFKDLQIVKNQKMITHLKEGHGHAGDASIIIFEGQKQ